MQAVEEAAQLLSAHDVATLLTPASAEDVAPSPTVIRPVRHRGNTAAARKAQPAPATTPVVDRMARAAARLRVVD